MRFVDLHVVEYGPDMEPYPLQVLDKELDMTERHLDRVKLIKDLLKPLDRWLDDQRISFSGERLLVFCYAISEKNDRSPEFIVSRLTKFS